MVRLPPAIMTCAALFVVLGATLPNTLFFWYKATHVTMTARIGMIAATMLAAFVEQRASEKIPIFK